MFNELDIVEAKYNIYLVKNKNGYLITHCKSGIDNKDIIFIIKKGTKGTIVMNYNTTDCEVEFFDENDNVIQTMEKKVISNKAICGAYYFKNKNIFKKSAQKYLDDCNYHEYFISGVYNIMIKENMKIKYFLTDLHISFGTPEEYKKVQNYNFKELL